MNSIQKLAPVTLEEFEAMEKDEHCKYELIDGMVMMSPSPSRGHQRIAYGIHGKLYNLLDQTGCEILGEYDINCAGSICKPDLMIFCDQDTELPEIVFEILSPSTKHRDLGIKVIKYEQAGIKEYWIIDPKIKAVTIHDYANQNTETYTLGDIIRSKARSEIIINVTDIFV